MMTRSSGFGFGQATGTHRRVYERARSTQQSIISDKQHATTNAHNILASKANILINTQRKPTIDNAQRTNSSKYN